MSAEDQPIFRDKNQAIGWEEAFDILHGQSSHHQYPCSDFSCHLLNLKEEKYFYSQQRKPVKEVSLQIFHDQLMCLITSVSLLPLISIINIIYIASYIGAKKLHGVYCHKHSTTFSIILKCFTLSHKCMGSTSTSLKRTCMQYKTPIASYLAI